MAQQWYSIEFHKKLRKKSTVMKSYKKKMCCSVIFSLNKRKRKSCLKSLTIKKFDFPVWMARDQRAPNGSAIVIVERREIAWRITDEINWHPVPHLSALWSPSLLLLGKPSAKSLATVIDLRHRSLRLTGPFVTMMHASVQEMRGHSTLTAAHLRTLIERVWQACTTWRSDYCGKRSPEQGNKLGLEAFSELPEKVLGNQRSQGI